MNQNSSDSRDEAVGHQSEDRSKLIPPSEDEADTPRGPLVISSQPVPWRLVVSKSTDPYAVHITFCVDGYMVDWVFARALLTGGLLEPTGEAPARMMAAFLKRTCQAVPLGTEHRHLDFDRLVSRLVQDVK